MDISVLPKVNSQSNTQTVAGNTVIKTAMDIVKENEKLMIETKQNIAVDTNLGQNIDVSVGKQMDAKVDKKKQVEQEMLWMQNRQKMMNTKEVKLLQMRVISQQAMQVNSIAPDELNKLNDRINSLAAQISAIDSDSSRTKDGKVLE